VNKDQQKKIKIIFRYDDFSSHSPTELEVKIIEIFRKIQSPITLGVTPFAVADQHDPNPQKERPLPTEKVSLLKEALNTGLIEIALHGYSHQTISAVKPSEFYGLDFAIQLEKLSQGKTCLEDFLGVYVETFLPPWNSYDENTLLALEKLGFTLISPYKGGAVFESTHLKFLPWTCFITDVKEALISARKISYCQPLIMVLLHDYDFVEVDESRGIIYIVEFEKLLDWLETQNDVEIISLSQAAEKIKDLSVDRYIANQQKLPLRTLIASTFHEEGASKYLYPEKTIPMVTWLKMIGFYIPFLLLGAGFSLLLSKNFLNERYMILQIAVWGSSLTTLFSLIYTFRDRFVYRRGMILNASLLGITIGFLISYLSQ